MHDDLKRIDQYSPLSHKLPLQAGQPRNWAPNWVPEEDMRRLAAYKVRAAYLENVSRMFIDECEAEDHREFGDPSTVVDRVVSGVLGDDMAITVDGADDDLPDTPNLPDPPDEPNPDATPIELRIHRVRRDRWEQAANDLVDEWEQALGSQPELQARQDWLREWADLEFFAGKAVEAEHDVAGLADGVYTLTPSHTAGRPVLDVYDPGMYFPVLTDSTRGYPTKVHVAWEFETEERDGTGTPVVKRFVRRKTWELVEVSSTMVDDNGDFVRDDTGQVTVAASDSIDLEGNVTRRYPWAPDEPSSKTCVFTDMTWPYDQLGDGARVNDFDPNLGTPKVNDLGQPAVRLDLGCDFIPVVHIPNTPASREHFGRSVLDVPSQIFDSIAALDTDVEAASAMAAGPAIALSGGLLAKDPTHPDGTVEVKPLAVFNLPENGQMDVLDLSAGITELRAVRGELLERLSVNARIPAEILGRVDAQQVIAGITTLLRFGPFRQLIESLRLTRDPKYRLLLKMVQRLAQLIPEDQGGLPAGANPTARIVFGSYLPADLAGVVTQVVSLLQAHGISRRTALQMLVAAGVDIEDVTDELSRIEAEDTSSAVQVADATGSEQLAAERLHLEIPDAGPGPVGPVVTLPGVPAEEPPPEPAVPGGE